MTPYRAKQVLALSAVSVNGGAVTGIAESGVHLVAFEGETTGDASYGPTDGQAYSRVQAGTDSGFGAYKLADPQILADVNANGLSFAADALDLSGINRFVQGAQVNGLIPLIPTGFTFPASGPDPVLSVPRDLTASPGGTVSVPVLLDEPMPAGSSGMTEATLALRYDPSVFDVSPADVHLGSIPGARGGWQLLALVDAASGQIAVALYGPAVMRDVAGSLVTMDLHVRADAPAGASAINLVDEVNLPGRGAVRTLVEDAQSAFVLSPAPTAAADDATDGIVSILHSAGPVGSAALLAGVYVGKSATRLWPPAGTAPLPLADSPASRSRVPLPPPTATRVGVGSRRAVPATNSAHRLPTTAALDVLFAQAELRPLPGPAQLLNGAPAKANQPS